MSSRSRDGALSGGIFRGLCVERLRKTRRERDGISVARARAGPGGERREPERSPLTWVKAAGVCRA